MKLKTIICIALTTAVCLQLTAAPKMTKPSIKSDLVLNDQTQLEDAVMKLLPKGSKLVHGITEGVFGPADGSKGSNINVVYSTKNKTPEIMVLTPIERGKYKKIKSETLNFGGKNTVEVLSVFFAQADKDSARELFVLCNVTGKKDSGYQTAVFDWTGKDFKRMQKIESKIKGIYPSINVKRALPEISGKK